MISPTSIKFLNLSFYIIKLSDIRLGISFSFTQNYSEVTARPIGYQRFALRLRLALIKVYFFENKRGYNKLREFQRAKIIWIQRPMNNAINI